MGGILNLDCDWMIVVSFLDVIIIVSTILHDHPLLLPPLNLNRYRSCSLLPFHLGVLGD